MSDRTYVIGLPVVVTVKDDGTVTWKIDASEASREIRRYEYGEDYTDETLDADAATVERHPMPPTTTTREDH